MISLEVKADEFSTLNISDLSLDPLPKVVDARGYLYIVQDSVYPEWVKIGRTVDPRKRLAAYNCDKPFNTAKYTYISSGFVDVIEVERVVLEKVYEISAPSTASKEWFQIELLENLVSIVEAAEKQFELLE